MPLIELRKKKGTRSPEDITVSVQDPTFDYLMYSPAPEIRVSAYLDRNWPEVLPHYAEIFVSDECQFESKVKKVTPGSRTRKDIVLPGAMNEGEQLVIQVHRISTLLPEETSESEKVESEE